MSKAAGQLFNPVNGSPEPIWTGFSWPCLVFGVFWYAYKGLWGWTLISLLLALLTGGISWFVFPFLANGQHSKSLLGRGYLTEEQRDEQRAVAARANGAQLNVADELAKLAALRDSGVLTAEEFATRKARLLA